MTTLFALAAALVLDRIMGEPDWLWSRVPHPIVVIGSAIGWADRRFNTPDLSDRLAEKRGAAVLAVLVIGAVLLGHGLTALLSASGPLGVAVEIVIVGVFLAWKSLIDHVKAVASASALDGLEGGRRAVSMIVGRDPARLDQAGVSRAAIESLAENASDGIVAPAFWFAVFGLPGLFAYKVINTADSMIGHLTPQYRAFGRAAAKIDDFANWLPARLTGFWLCVFGSMGHDSRRHITTMLREAKHHRSPNAGWPESAMASVLGIALGGPRVYANDLADEPFINDAGRRDVTHVDIDRALLVLERTMWAVVLLVIVAACAQLGSAY